MRSAQKLPIADVSRRAKPRMTAMSTAIPTAADTKFWTARPAIWENSVNVVSPP